MSSQTSSVGLASGVGEAVPSGELSGEGVAAGDPVSSGSPGAGEDSGAAEAECRKCGPEESGLRPQALTCRWTPRLRLGARPQPSSSEGVSSPSDSTVTSAGAPSGTRSLL